MRTSVSFRGSVGTRGSGELQDSVGKGNGGELQENVGTGALVSLTVQGKPHL